MVDLGELTLRDEHRLRRLQQRLRRHADERSRARFERELEAARERVARRRAGVPALTYPAELPVSARRDELAQAIAAHPVVVVAGETGSGKTTQLPKVCLELGRGVRGAIAHTQPRRLAARTVAARIASELGVELGGAVGYSVRFSDRAGEDTLLRLVTDGLLLAETRHDPLLRRYDTVIVDEAHERSLNIDFLLGYLKRLLPRRPDLKLIITSATIDPERFSRHFDGAPVLEVSGRTYPVELRYRDEPEPDPLEAIAGAVEELQREGPGDVLVFLSGEREIRDAAELLRGRLGTATEVLPLYARLATADQLAVFQPHERPRVVLATNVAETSVTVPGIRYVVDPGMARISRYSARLKVQQLPIEPVSQASAQQRAGRCGRTAAGICIRLYSEQDFEQRPRFTDPEILRTSLASVILQMAANGLGEIEDFPFMDPPDRRQVRDGITLLTELGALDERRRLTQLGRRLAALPVDPRLGRMVLEAAQRGCADEVIVITAALSIVDPRERPAEQREAADAAHARFAHPGSDFVAYLNLWRHLQERQRELSGNQFRKLCRAEFLHYLRVREWQDLVWQLRQAGKGAGVHLNKLPAGHDDVHAALLAGLLSHIGRKDARGREYDGARGARWAIFPGSALAAKPPGWAMAAELVQTSRLWGRDVARIDPQWIEPLARHLVKRSHDDPRWERRRASAVTTEHVTLYGLEVAARTVPYGPIDPVQARALFISHALVEGDWGGRHDFLTANRVLRKRVEELEDRVRRRDILVGDDAIFAFYDERVPAEIASGADFDRWWKQERNRRPDLLTLTREHLTRPGSGAVDAAAWPDDWHGLRLSYRFEPGAPDDGVSVHVPLKLLATLRPGGFDWLVPGLRLELVTALLRSLPKPLRTQLVPMPDTAAQVIGELDPGRGALVAELSRAVERVRGVRIPAEAWDSSRLPAHLRMRFVIEGERGATVAHGHDLDALREQVRPRLQAELTQAASAFARSGLRDWSIGELPQVVALEDTGGALRSYPALADEGDSVGVRVFESRAAQQRAMRAGTRRLLLLALAGPIAYLKRNAGPHALALAAAPAGTFDDIVSATVDALVAEAGGPAWDEPAWRALREHVAGHFAARALEAVAATARVLDAANALRTKLAAIHTPTLAPAADDIARQLGRLVHPGFVRAAGTRRLADIERYLQAASRRLNRLPNAVAVDRDRMRAIHELEAAYRDRIDAIPKGTPIPRELTEARWLLEELRVAQLAPGIPVRGQVSAKRVRANLKN